MSMSAFNLFLTSIFSVVDVTSLQPINSAFKQMNQSAHAHTQWQSQWCTGNLLQQYWWAVLTCCYGVFLLIAHDVVRFLRTIAESISTSSITVWFRPLPPPAFRNSSTDDWLSAALHEAAFFATVENNKPERVDAFPAANLFWKNPSCVTQHWSVKKKGDGCLSGVFTKVVSI